MSADRYEITDNNASIRCQKPGKGPLILYACDRDSSTQKIIAVIRQLRADLAAVSAENAELRIAMQRQANAVKMMDTSRIARAEAMMQHAQVLHDQSNLSALESERAANALLTAELAAVSAERDRLRDENAALLAANRDCKLHFDALKGDYDEAAHFARHFIRDDPSITPRGAIIRLGAKCTDLFFRQQQAEAQLAEYVDAPTIAVVNSLSQDAPNYLIRELLPPQHRPPIGTELIARVKK